MTERVFEPSRRVLCDVLVERARHGARGEDALDSGVVARTERRGMAERAIDLVGGVALPQEQDLAGLCAPDSRWTEAHQPKELRRMLAHVVERDVDLIEIDRTAPLRGWVQSGGIEPEARAARSELVTRDASQVSGVDKQLALGDAQRQDLGDVIVGDGVVIAGPGDEAVDTAHAIDHACGVVGIARQRDQPVALFCKSLERGALLEHAVIDDAIEPVRELRAHVVEVAELAAVEERALDLPERALDPRLVVGVPTPDGERTKFVMTREREKARIVDGLIALPAQHDWFLAVVLTLLRAALETGKGAIVSIHQGV